MEKEKKDRRVATAVALLKNLEIDGFVVAQLGLIDNIGEILCAVVEDRIETSALQKQNAAYVLGRLGEQAAAPVLVSTLSKNDRSLRLACLISLAAIGPDEDSQKTLKAFADDKDTGSVEAAYAREALAVKPQKRKNPLTPVQR